MPGAGVKTGFADVGLEEAIDAGVFALGAAGLSKGIRRQARAACEDYFYNRLDLKPDLALGTPKELPEGLELMPDEYEAIGLLALGASAALRRAAR